MGEAKWRRDNPNLARAAARRDRTEYLSRLAAKHSQTLRFIGFGNADMENSALMVEHDMFVPLEIGSRGDLTAARAQAAATFFKQIEERAGPGCIYVHLAGYDSDPRELWDIPEAAGYVRLWAHLAGLDINSAPTALHEISLSLLAACGVFGETAQASMNLPPKVTEQ
jgi:hypothetical protein